VRLLYLLGGVLSAGNGAVFALLPELQDDHGLPTWSLGTIAAAAFAAGLASQLALARYADRGHARLMLAVGGALACTGFVATGFGTELWQLIAARGMAGLGIGMVFPAARKVLVTLNPHAVGQTLGRFLAVDIGGFVLGAPIAAAIAEVGGIELAFGSLAAVGAVCLPVVLRRPLPPMPAIEAASANRRVLRQLLGRRQLRAGLSLGVATFGAIGVFDTIWARYLKDLGASPIFIGVTLACFGLPMAALAGRGGRMADHRGPLRVGIVGVALSVPMMSAYGQTGMLALLTILAIVHSVVDAVNMPATQAAVASQCAPHEIAAGQGLLSGVQMSTAALSALGVAPLYGRFGPGPTFLVTGAVMAAAWVSAFCHAGGVAGVRSPAARALAPVGVEASS
jgi:DHA1 family inner membrane transport protein